MIGIITYQVEGQAIPECHGVFDNWNSAKAAIPGLTEDTPDEERWRWRIHTIEMNEPIYWTSNAA